jgi:type II secretory pathway pseudopilin PulG
MYAIYVTNILVIIIIIIIITALVIAYYGSIFQIKDFLNFFKVVIRDHTSHYFKNKMNSC